uniref:Uncharacterized protein n=1 Tax=Hucho hucho TaxID=62062 RepID=A0A4W5NY53_9TELE
MRQQNENASDRIYGAAKSWVKNLPYLHRLLPKRPTACTTCKVNVTSGSISRGQAGSLTAVWWSIRRTASPWLFSHPVEYFRRGVPLLDRDNLGLVLLLHPTGPFSPEACVCVWPTHTSFITPGMGTLCWPSWLCCWQRSEQCPATLTAALVSSSSMGTCAGVREGGESQMLTFPIWPHSLGVTQQCQYETPPTDVDGGISNLSVQDFEVQAMATMNRGSIAQAKAAAAGQTGPGGTDRPRAQLL